MSNHYKPYADFKYVDGKNGQNVSLKFQKHKHRNLSNNSNNSLLSKFNRNKLQLYENLDVEQCKDLDINFLIFKDHKFSYGIQFACNAYSSFFDFIYSYKTHIIIFDEFMVGFGCMFLIPGYLFSQCYTAFEGVRKHVFFAGPILIPFAYSEKDFSISLQLRLLFAIPFLKQNMVFINNKFLLLEEIDKYYKNYFYLSEYGFIHFVFGLELMQYFYSLFFGIRFCTHLEDLNIVHLVQHICFFAWKSMFYKSSACYTFDAMVLRNCLIYENTNTYELEPVSQLLKQTKNSFCSLDFIFDFCIL